MVIWLGLEITKRKHNMNSSHVIAWLFSIYYQVRPFLFHATSLK